MTIYNLSGLESGTNIVHWMLWINSWTDGILAIVLIIGGALVTFAVSRLFQIDMEDAFIASTFIWGLISALVWVIEWNGLRFIPTLIPILFFVFCGIAVLGKMIRGSTT